MKKQVQIDKRAQKEIDTFPSLAKAHVYTALKILARDGQLTEPEAKKLTTDLFEIRIRTQGQWRVLYAYLIDNLIMILSAFQKKTSKTPQKELLKAKSRLKTYR